jgi:copper resistance protein D
MVTKTDKIIILSILTVSLSLALPGIDLRPTITLAAQTAKAAPAAPQKETPAATSQPAEQESMPGMDMGQNSTPAKTETKPEISTGGNVIPPGASDTVRFTGKEWSEYNHRAAGWFLFFWGLTALAVGLQWPRKTWIRFAPGVVLLGMVEFLFVRNDPESWPTGAIGLWASLRDPEVFQHRVYLILLLLIALVELLRAADKLTPFYYKYALPILATLGGIYLFFHKHGGAAMQQMMAHASDPKVASNPMFQSMIAAMKTIKHEHMMFSIFGFGLAAAKLLADMGKIKGRLGATLWTLFAIILGVYMMGYVE